MLHINIFFMHKKYAYLDVILTACTMPDHRHIMQQPFDIGSVWAFSGKIICFLISMEKIVADL